MSPDMEGEKIKISGRYLGLSTTKFRRKGTEVCSFSVYCHLEAMVGG